MPGVSSVLEPKLFRKERGNQMSDQPGTAVATQTRQQTGIERIKDYMLSTEVKERFTDMMGANGIYYLNQVMIVVAGSANLQKCTPSSILVSAMRAASLKLSVDPARGEAWIIPYREKASFQLGYKGVYELAMRTNQYRVINVVDIFEGEELIEDRMTGIHTIAGERTGNKVIALMLYFQLFNGFQKTFVMTIPEIEAHAKTYSQSYNYDDSPWNAHNGRERMKMMRKTVMVNGLRKWGRFNPDDKETIEAIEGEQEWHDNVPDENTVTVEPNPIKEASSDELVGMLFGAESEKKPSAPIDVESKSADPLWHDFPGISVPDLSIEKALQEKTHDGKFYASLETSKLQIMAAEDATIIRSGKVSGKVIDDTQRTNYLFKLSAIRAILMGRESK
jgi:recombination protein RecT